MLRLRAALWSETSCRSTWIALRSIPRGQLSMLSPHLSGDGVCLVPDTGVTLRSSSLTSCGDGDGSFEAGDALSGTESRLCGSVTRILGSASCMVVLACVLGLPKGGCDARAQACDFQAHNGCFRVARAAAACAAWPWACPAVRDW